MSDPLREAAQALLDTVDRDRTIYYRDLGALRSALSAPVTSPDAQAVELLREARDQVCVRVQSLEETYRGYPERWHEESMLLSRIDAFLSQRGKEGGGT